MKTGLLFIIGIYSSFVWAQVQLDEMPNAIDQAVVDEAVAEPAAMEPAIASSVATEMLKQDMKPYMLSMAKESRVYHYFNMPEQSYQYVQTEQGRNQYAKWHFDGVMNSYWDPRTTIGSFLNAGAGLYAAIDPYSSMEFGNSILEITIPVGTKYLDVYKKFPIRKETIAALISEGLIDPSLATNTFPGNTFWRDTLKYSLHPNQPKFRKLLRDIFIQNDIGLIAYEYKADVSGFCRVRQMAAFAFIGVPESMKSNGMPVYRDNFYKRIMPANYDLPNMSEIELFEQARTLKFRDVLQGMNQITGYGPRVTYVKSQYPVAAERIELANKTYKCEL